MSWLVIGKGGQLSSALAAQSDQLLFWGREELDLSLPQDQIRERLEKLPKTDGIIIAAAYTNVDLAETEQNLASQVNIIAPREIAKYCAAENLPLVYISTDYVFDGETSKAYSVCTQKSPVNFYGYTKSVGEDYVFRHHPGATVVRTSGVFYEGFKNFPATMLSLRSKSSIKVVMDQVMRPTYAPELAKALLHMIRPEYSEKLPGHIYHITGSGADVHWADFAKETYARLPSGTNSPTVEHINSFQFGAHAARPAFSVLDISKFQDSFDYKLPDWSKGLTEFVRKMI